MSTPVVAIIGATGYVGNFLTKSFLEALHESRVKEVRLLTTKKTEKTTEFETQGAKVFHVSFSKKETLLAALKSVDIVISAMGTGTGSVESRDVLLEAIVQCGVDVYFPSEFGTNHYATSRMKVTSDAFSEKRKHFNDAKSKSGLKTVRLHCAMIMEYTFGKWIGLDCQTGVWTIPGSGNTIVALTAAKDIGRFTVEAALMAFKDPDAVPEAIEIVGTAKTLKEYAGILDAVSGQKTKFKFLSLDEAMGKYEKTKNFLDVFPLLFETGALALEPKDANGNQLLNPGESNWTLKSIEEYAQETGGRPVV